MKPVGVLGNVRVSIDGAPLTGANAASLSSIQVRQRLSLPTLCELTFSPRLGKSAEPPAIGATVNVLTNDGALFAGEVTALEHSCGAEGRMLRVRAYDPLHRLRKQQRVTAHVQFTAASLARELAEPLGLTVDGGSSAAEIARTLQYRQNDFDFLTEICERAGLYFFADGETLRLFELSEPSEPIALTLGEELRQARIEINAETMCDSVAAVGWDPLLVELRDGRATRQLQRADELILGTAVDRILADQLLLDDAHAGSLAQADLDRRVAGELTVWGVASGNPSLIPGARVAIEGVAAAPPREAVLTTVDHTITRSGHLTEFSNPLPRPRLRDRAATAVIGVVARVDDPEGRGRVKLTLPTYGDAESEWLPVITAGGGAGKGWISVPDVDDRVVAIFPGGEAGIGFVVGGLYHERHPDPGVESGRVKRYSFLSPNGQKLQFDDGCDSIRLQNKQGSYVEMTPEKLVIHAAGDLDIEAPGRTITIRGQAIDFERG